jgi:hypothetical protein
MESLVLSVGWQQQAVGMGNFGDQSILRGVTKSANCRTASLGYGSNRSHPLNDDLRAIRK